MFFLITIKHTVKKAFTLVEVLLILSIIGILTAAITSFVQESDRRKILYAETCLNNMDANIKNFVNAAMTSKKLTINNTTLFPDYYFIKFRPASGSITFEYEGATT